MTRHAASILPCVALTAVVATTCKESASIEGHCANNAGNISCAQADPLLPWCQTCVTSNVEGVEGCVAERPEDACLPFGADHCAAQAGNFDGYCRLAGLGQFCDGCIDENRGCVDAKNNPDHCYADGTTTADTGGSTGEDSASGPGPGTETEGDPTGGTTGGGSTDATAGSSDDGPMGCEDDDDCTAVDAAFCVEGLCAPCSATAEPDDACAAKFPDTPACVASECVQCSATVTGACTGTTPVCDTATSTCVGCTTHEQCPASACHIPYPGGKHPTDDDGACFDPSTVVHVDGDGEQDFTTIGEAVASFEAVGDQGVIIVHDAASSYDDVVSVDGDRVLAILAADGETPVWETDDPGSQLSLSGTGTTVFLDRMRLTLNGDNGAAAVRLTGGRAHIQRSSIVQNSGGGIHAESNALLYVENSFVGMSADDHDAVVVNGSDASIVYSTLVGNAFNSVALACSDPGTIVVRNSILVSRGGTPPDEVACDADITYSATEGNIAGMGNVAVDAFPQGSPQTWFVNFTSGDYSLQMQGPSVFADIAQWHTGDPSTDIDGDARPNTDGAMDYAGADVTR